MKRITTDNYEAFVLDYLEGTILPKDKAMLLAFLHEHPELYVDLSAELPVLDSAAIFFENKYSLHRTANDLLSNRVIRFVENQLSATERTALLDEAGKNDALRRELELMQLTRLVPEPVAFPNRSQLKKRTVIITLRQWTAIAAVMCGIFLGFYLFTPGRNEVARVAPPAAGRHLFPATEEDPPLPERVQEAALPGKAIASVQRSKKRVAARRAVAVTFDSVAPLASVPPSKELDPAKTEPAVATVTTPAKTGTAVTDSLAESFPVWVVTEEEEPAEPSGRKRFWKRAVALASRVHALGVAGVDGEVEERDHFRISFNSFSVEKK